MRKISYKLILGMIILVSVTLGSIWLYQTVFLERNYTNRIVDTLKTNLHEAANLYEAGDMTGFEEYAENILISRNITIEVFGIDGMTTLRGPGGMRGQMAGSKVLKGAYLDELLRSGEALTRTTHPRQNLELIAYSILIPESEIIITGTIPAEPISETVGILKDQLVGISLLLLILSAAIGTFIARMLLKPVRELNRTVNQLAEGNMDARAEVSTKDELGELANNFNRMADQLSKLDSLRKDLVANVSHELRTPLGLIRGYAELARDVQYEQTDNRRESLDIIIEETDRLSVMVDDILNLSQIQAGYADINPVEGDITADVQTAVSKYIIAAENKGIELLLETDKDSEIAYYDAKRLQQVFHNLITNAINHTDPGGKVSISVESLVSAVRIEVRDTGTGIPEEELPFIWERYYKIDKSGSGAKGSGIGLAIVKGILEAHGSKYGFESKLGAGTTFWFEIDKNSK
jgi:signal transduction histidine kinase